MGSGKRLKGYVRCAVMVAMFSGAAGAQEKPAKNDPQVEAEIRRLLEDGRKAFLRADVDAIARVYADDFVVTNPFNKFLTQKQVLEMVRGGTLAFKEFTREVQYVRQYGEDTVIAAGEERGIWGGKLPTAGQPLHLRFTAVFRKRDGRWQIVARHASMVQPSKP
jgi:uncharacterized protein (TIGR02246 family)